MERSEPTFVPEWLKNAGSSTAGSSISHSDDHSTSRVARNKSFVNSNGQDFGRSSSSERTTSSYFRRSSSSNSSGSYRPYSSFGSRNQRESRDRDREKDAHASRDQESLILGDRRHRNFSDPLGDTSLGKFDGDVLRRSHSMISGKRGDSWPKKVATDSISAIGKSTNGLVTKSSPVGVSKATFERDFPSLGAEERVAVYEVGRVPSPGLSTAIQSLPIGTSASMAVEKWTSALAEVPVLAGSNGTASASMQGSPSSSTSASLGPATSLNMAEAVAHGPIRAQSTPQLSVGTQRLEELAIKQSRQLIPVTPSMPKALVLNDKQKNKVGPQQHSSLPLNHSPRVGPVKGDAPKASNVGKLHLLKPVREKNGVTPVIKDILSPTSVGVHAAPPSVTGPAATKGPQISAGLDRKPVSTGLEKRSTSQAQSRNDFFNLVRKKSMANPTSSDSAGESSQSAPSTGTAASPSFSDKTEMEVMPAKIHPVEAPFSVDYVSEVKATSTCNGDAHDAHKYDIDNGEKHPTSDPIISEEEEAAFLRSMGWEENDDEGGLTDEEISAFYRDLYKYINSKPSRGILQRVQLKFLLPLDSQLGGGIGGISSGLSSTDAKLES